MYNRQIIKHFTICAILLSSCILLLQSFDLGIWWSFIILSSIFGFIYPFKTLGISSTTVGFVTGFLIWSGSMVYFEFSYDGNILEKMGDLIDFHHYWLILASGGLGGVMTALGLYLGDCLKLKERNDDFDFTNV